MMKHLLIPALLIAPLAACNDGEAVGEAAAIVDMPALVNPNSADAAALGRAEGMDADLIDAVLAERPFADGVEFNNFLARYTDDTTREIILGDVFVPLSINSADEADFKIIPGVGDKMAHEFEEYRPYADFAQFDREIGKYVDAEEVARLRRYIVID